MEQLDKRIVKDFSERMNLSLKNACRNLLPASMVTEVLSRAGLDVDSKVNQLDKKNRLKLVDSIKDFTVTLKGLRDINEAIITRGGVKVSEIDPSTMESKQIQGLFFAGEVLDLDALTGGFNLQIAWSTGYLAGREESN
jgi:predicted Rossmann fold flavoprotein